MKNCNRLLLILLIILAMSPLIYSQDRFAIKDARIVTVSGPIIEKGTVLLEAGSISAVGEKVRIPRGTRVISGKGLTVYPGLFDCNTRLGLTEIGAVEMSNDMTEMGEFTPHLLAFDAIHVESEHIPVTRVEGVTHTLTRPSGGTIPGQGALVHLDGWSHEEMEIDRNGALILRFPSQLRTRPSFGGSSSPRSYSDIKKEFEKKIKEISDLFSRARHYEKAQKDDAVSYDKVLDSLIPAVNGKQVVMVEANSHVDIKNAVEFCEKEKLNYVILGGSDAWRIPEFLKEHQTSVILGQRQVTPSREDDPQDILYRTPAILHEAGIKFALSVGGSASVRTLPFEMGNTVGRGLPWNAGVRAITLTPAEILGVDGLLGSIDEGKIGNLVVTDGDIFEYKTSIKHVFIKGVPISLETKHTKLYQKYINRP